MTLHPKKTKIVQCLDYRRKKKHSMVKFDFLGFSFQPRVNRGKYGKSFLGFDCAISIASRKKIISTIKSFQFHRWSGATIKEIAETINSKLRGWVNFEDLISLLSGDNCE